MTVAPSPAPCAVCNRAGRGIAFIAPGVRADFCSMKCSGVYMLTRANGIELHRNEADAALAGGKAAGAYLDGIGKTDLARMTKDEWAQFCAELVAGYVADLQRQAREHVPF